MGNDPTMPEPTYVNHTCRKPDQGNDQFLNRFAFVNDADYIFQEEDMFDLVLGIFDQECFTANQPFFNENMRNEQLIYGEMRPEGFSYAHWRDMVEVDMSRVCLQVMYIGWAAAEFEPGVVRCVLSCRIKPMGPQKDALLKMLADGSVWLSARMLSDVQEKMRYFKSLIAVDVVVPMLSKGEPT
jgi:hypothetical protein